MNRCNTILNINWFRDVKIDKKFISKSDTDADETLNEIAFILQRLELKHGNCKLHKVTTQCLSVTVASNPDGSFDMEYNTNQTSRTDAKYFFVKNILLKNC